jgi:hypothetical protein
VHVGTLVEGGVVGADRCGYWLDVEEEQTVEQWDVAGPGGAG